LSYIKNVTGGQAFGFGWALETFDTSSGLRFEKEAGTVYVEVGKYALTIDNLRTGHRRPLLWLLIGFAMGFGSVSAAAMTGSAVEWVLKAEDFTPE
jgi:hypothetical protein